MNANATLWTMAEEIARELTAQAGETWKAIAPDPEDHEYKYTHSEQELAGRVTLQGPRDTEEKLTLRAGGYRSKGRMTVSPNYPRHNGSILPWRDEDRVGSITVTLEKAPKAIARDIARRLLDGYRVAFKKGVEARDANLDHESRTNAVVAELAAIVGIAPRNSGSNATIYAYGGEGKPTVELKNFGPDSVTIDIRYAKPELAKKIVKLVYAAA